MSNFSNEPELEKLTLVIDQLLNELKEKGDSTADNYSNAVDNLVKLTKLKNETLKTENDRLTDFQKINADEQKNFIDSEKLEFEKAQFEFEKEKSASWRPSPDAIVTAAASILGIVAILHYEKLGNVTSKALGFITKMK